MARNNNVMSLVSTMFPATTLQIPSGASLKKCLKIRIRAEGEGRGLKEREWKGEERK